VSRKNVPGKGENGLKEYYKRNFKGVGSITFENEEGHESALIFDGKGGVQDTDNWWRKKT
jgi:hypothetical protein